MKMLELPTFEKMRILKKIVFESWLSLNGDSVSHAGYVNNLLPNYIIKKTNIKNK